ncbi:MAG TPA: flagellar biosynthetic protein FliO [Nitrospiria bacterium]|nr:flagellar biosynthetic protein FliO [Nitrospiria bacterium]
MELAASVFKMGASLLVVIGLIALTAYAARRFFGDRLGRWRSGPAIQVLSRAYLGGRKEIALIEVGEAYLVVGITPGQISMLTRLRRPLHPSSLVGPATEEIGRP